MSILPFDGMQPESLTASEKKTHARTRVRARVCVYIAPCALDDNIKYK